MQITRHRPTPPRPLAPKQLQLPEEQTWSDSVYAGGQHSDLGIRLNTAVFTPLMLVPGIGPVLGGVTVAGCLGLSLQNAYAATRHNDKDLLRRSLVNAAISGTLTGAAAAMLGAGPPQLGPVLVGAAAVMVVGREIHARLSSKP